MYIVRPRSILTTNAESNIWDVVADESGFHREFSTYEDAKKYAEESGIATYHPRYLVVETVWK